MTLFGLAQNPQMPDNARPNVSLGEVRAAIAEARADALREAAERVRHLPRFDCKGYITIGRDAVLAILDPETWIERHPAQLQMSGYEWAAMQDEDES